MEEVIVGEGDRISRLYDIEGEGIRFYRWRRN